MSLASKSSRRPPKPTPPSLRDGIYELSGGTLRYHFHPGQHQAWKARERFICVLAGSQGGKTSFFPAWLHREMQTAGPGDYLVVTPSFPLLDKKALPEFRKLFEDYLGLGRYVGSPTRRFEVSPVGQRRLWGVDGRAYRTTIWFGYATDPDSLESMTAKAACLDEAGQVAFRRESYEAILRRLAIHEGRVLITTTPYYHGWLKHMFWDRRDADSALIRFESRMNPTFPAAEWERLKATLPPWKFDMFHRAMFTRPAGIIYDNWDAERMTCSPFEIPAHWPRFIGLDFGGVNLAAVFIAQRPEDGRLFLYREYHAGGRTAAEHAAFLLAGEAGEFEAFGGAPGEQQWRDEFTAAGLRIRRPVVGDVEVGIDRVYGLFARQQLTIFDTCYELLDELSHYSRVLDAAEQPTEAIANKSSYHLLDALRYVGSYLGIDAAAGESDWIAPYDPLSDLEHVT